MYVPLRCEAGESDAELTRRINEDPEGFVTRELLGQAPSDVVLTVSTTSLALPFTCASTCAPRCVALNIVSVALRIVSVALHIGGLALSIL